jgi:hypothetical protein
VDGDAAGSATCRALAGQPLEPVVAAVATIADTLGQQRVESLLRACGDGSTMSTSTNPTSSKSRTDERYILDPRRTLRITAATRVASALTRP